MMVKRNADSSRLLLSAFFNALDQPAIDCTTQTLLSQIVNLPSRSCVQSKLQSIDQRSEQNVHQEKLLETVCDVRRRRGAGIISRRIRLSEIERAGQTTSHADSRRDRVHRH